MTRGNGGKSPGTQVQHTLSIGTKGTEFRRFLASKCGTVRAITKSAGGFAPIAVKGHPGWRNHWRPLINRGHKVRPGGRIGDRPPVIMLAGADERPAVIVAGLR